MGCYSRHAREENGLGSFEGRGDGAEIARMMHLQVPHACKHPTSSVPHVAVRCSSVRSSGRTHALMMDEGVIDCVLECLCDDFAHFEAQVPDLQRVIAKLTASGRQAVNRCK